jgi:hypothetical protein|tara:strand:- start:1960 stop:2676 length:717 start_codon:yes stop_codon:yes gene_type:complete
MRSILVIGGNSDIGYATAKVFAKNKYNIHLASRNMDQLNNKKKEIENLYAVECKVTQLDLLQDDQIVNFFDKNPKSPDIILIALGFMQSEEKNFERIINSNYLSPLKFIEKSLINYLPQKQLKTIIGISSVAGDRGKKRNTIYSSSKSAFSSYLDGLRQRLYSDGVHVITVKPGWVATKMTRDMVLPKIMTTNANFVGNKIFKSYKSKKNTLYVPKFWLIIMFFYKMVPEILFKFFAK